jgi:hypothetical protein
MRVSSRWAVMGGAIGILYLGSCPLRREIAVSIPSSRDLSVPSSSVDGQLVDAAGAVVSFRTTAGWGNVAGSWAAAVSTQAATFEGWIRTTVKDAQTIILGSNAPGATPRISVGGDRLSVYWNTGGKAPGSTSADTTPVTDGRWHHRQEP